LLLLALAGCPDRSIASVYPVQGTVETKDLPAVPNRDVDILFLIDDSGSMQEEQASLRANFGRFMSVLETLEGGIPNVHIGVATSNMGQRADDGVGTASFGTGCANSGDDGVLRTAAPISGRFIIDEEGGGGARTRNYSGSLADAFSALADVGIDGCGIEQHLAAIERTLGNPMNVGFLRPDAKLAVIVIADEDDCSLSSKALFEGTGDGTVVNFRCTREGIECDDGADLSIPGLRRDCHPKDDSTMVKQVDHYVDYLRSLKANPKDDVIVAGIVGDAAPFETAADGMGRTILEPSCSYGTQHAYPAVRTADFLSQFSQHVNATICGADLSGAMVDIGALIKRSLGDPCFAADVADLDPSTPGLQADCTVSDVRVLPDGDVQELSVIPACGTGKIPCWRIEEDAALCSYTHSDPHYKLVVDRGGAVPPSDIHVRASCVTTDGTGSFL
jgi:hypothetical protein